MSAGIEKLKNIPIKILHTLYHSYIKTMLKPKASIT